MIALNSFLLVGDFVMSPDGLAKVIETRTNIEVKVALVGNEKRTYVFTWGELDGIEVTPKMLLDSGFKEFDLLSTTTFKQYVYGDETRGRSISVDNRETMCYTETHVDGKDTYKFEIIKATPQGATSASILRFTPLYVHELQHTMEQCDYYVDLKI